MFLKEISDDFLVCLYFEKNQDAIDLLFERYKVFIYGIISSLQKKVCDYIDFDDLFQEGFHTFLNCIERYDDENGCFYFFVRKSIERKLIDKISKLKKNETTLSLDACKYIDSNENLIDYIAEESSYDYYDNCLYDKLVSRVDDNNKKIIDLKLMGYSYYEIANLTGTNKQDIYRRVSKIKNILKDIIEKID